jgi:hypothetical protein
MAQEEAPLTPEEKRLKQLFADEDAGKSPFGFEEELEFPPLPPLPTEEGDVVAVIIPHEKQHGS